MERRARMMRGMILLVSLASAGCATLTNDPMVPVATSFSDGSDGTCEFQNKRGLWKADIPATVMIRRSDDSLVFRCRTSDGREASGSMPSTMDAKIVASAVFLDLGITDSITDMHREYPASYVIPIHAKGQSGAAVPVVPAVPGAPVPQPTSVDPVPPPVAVDPVPHP
jgi:hypothetical protein